ncbi:integrase family protein [bacterium]|nr:integrase family protein [bacterium]
MKLTHEIIDKLKPAEKAYYVSDGGKKGIPGLRVRVNPTGRKVFVYEGYVGNKQRRVTLGQYGKITLKEAQDIAKGHGEKFAKGVDPVIVKQQAKGKAITLGEAADLYIEARTAKNAKKPLKPSTVYDIRICMKALSDWKKRPVTSITRSMIQKRHLLLGEKSPARANLTFRYLRAVLNYISELHATDDGRGLLPSNPVKILSATKQWFEVKSRDTYLKQHEIKPYIQAVLKLDEPPQREPGTGHHYPKLKHGDMARDAFLILLLTGLRRGELQSLSWDDIDFKGRTLTIPDPKNREPHTLPLSDYLFDLLENRRKISKGPLVLSGPDGVPFRKFRYGKQRIKDATDIELNPHDLRRSFATAAESLNISYLAVKSLLNHKSGGDITRQYVKITAERLREPMQQITDYFMMTAGVKKPRIIDFNTVKQAVNEP